MTSRIFAYIILFLMICFFTLLARDTKTLDDGKILLFLSNDGVFGFDESQSRFFSQGFYYPKDTYRWMMSGAGIWIAGKKNEQWHLSTATPDRRFTHSDFYSEFVPRPVEQENPFPLEIPIYKLTKGENKLENPDYSNWPAHLGAPVNQLGEPLIKGSQAVYTIFSDTDSTAHDFAISGTPPLGVEVQLYAYTFDNTYQIFDSILTQVVIFEYQISNKSDEQIDSCILTLWVDSDIGAAFNDLLACDTILNAGYSYNSSEYDSEQGHNPPVIGFAFLNQDLWSFNYYEYFTKWDTLDVLGQTMNLVKGRRLNGDPYIDPTTSEETKFPFSGNPLDSSGWLNDDAKDFRFLINTPPQTLAAGETIKLHAAMILADGNTIPEGITKFKETVVMLNELYSNDSNHIEITTQATPVYKFEDQTFSGFNWGGRFLNGGLDLGKYYFHTDQVVSVLPDVKIDYSISPRQRLYRYQLVNDSSIYLDYHKQGIDIHDYNTGERLDGGFIDLDNDGTINNSKGYLDPLIVFTNGFNKTPHAVLTSSNAVEQLSAIVIQPKLQLAELNNNSITIYGDRILSDFEKNDTIYFKTATNHDYLETSIQLTNPTKFHQEVNLIFSSELFSISQTSLDLPPEESRWLFLKFQPDSAGVINDSLLIYSYGIQSNVEIIQIQAVTTDFIPWGDADGDAILGVKDILLMIDYLFYDKPIVVPLKQLDGNCDSLVNLVDLMLFISVLYLDTEISCQD